MQLLISSKWEVDIQYVCMALSLGFISRMKSALQRLVRASSSSSIRSLATAASVVTETPLKKTVLHDYHVENGGKMVPFAGWSMPLMYTDSILNSTINCRQNGSLFDVSHMCGLSLKGKDAIPFLESLVVSDIIGLREGTGCLSAFTNENGGTIDDTVITKVKDDHIYLVVNAGCRDKDLEHVGKHLEAFKAGGKDVNWHIHDERSLLALQGPLAARVLQKLVKEELSKMYFGDFRMMDVSGVACYVTRTGYTGEDGFELSVPSERAVDVTKDIMDKGEGKIALTGLGARDSLRLEAGLCLYGNDMDEETSVVEAGLAWTIGKRRRVQGGFKGWEKIMKQLKEGVERKRIGLVSTGAPARQHSKLYDSSSSAACIGEVTSGAFSPCLKKNISMGYVKVGSGLHKEGSSMLVNVRDKMNEAVVTKMPFVPAKYYKKP